MSVSPQEWLSKYSPPAEQEPPSGGGRASVGAQAPLITASSALYLIRHRTGIPVPRATFYRWLSEGRVFSCRLGQKLYIPLSVIEETVKKCRSGDRL